MYDHFDAAFEEIQHSFYMSILYRPEYYTTIAFFMHAWNRYIIVIPLVVLLQPKIRAHGLVPFSLSVQ